MTIEYYTYDASGNLEAVTDPKGQKTVYLVNKNGKIDLASYYAREADAAALRTVDYAYDDLGRLASYADQTAGEAGPDSSAVYAYDAGGRKIRETVTYPGGFSVAHSYAYNADGRKKSYTGPDGVLHEPGRSD